MTDLPSAERIKQLRLEVDTHPNCTWTRDAVAEVFALLDALAAAVEKIERNRPEIAAGDLSVEDGWRDYDAMLALARRVRGEG